MFEVKFGGKRHPAATLKEASKLFTDWIAENDFGASDLAKSDGWLYKTHSPRTHFGEVSYNGRTWKGTYGVDDFEEIFDTVIEVIEPQDEAPAATAIAKIEGKASTIADVIREGLSAGLTTDEILANIKKAHPNAKTSPACVAYYRSKMKKAGATVAPKTKKLAKPKGKYVFKKLKYLVPEWKQGYTAEVYLDGAFVGNVIDFMDDGGDNPHYEFDVMGAKDKVDIKQMRLEVAAIFASKKK